MGKFAILLVKEGDICNINFMLGKYAIKTFYKGKYAITLIIFLPNQSSFT
ncbi:hypothetical protein HanPI659440_Chr10g0399741 [Helianthus annuus]|nr:hypothetical protein HanPI659440_Chr10g0399741 [Helianthus annuus]